MSRVARVDYLREDGTVCGTSYYEVIRGLSVSLTPTTARRLVTRLLRQGVTAVVAYDSP